MGDVYGLASTTNLGLDKVRFTVGLTSGGSPVDFSKSTMTFTTEDITSSLGNPESGVTDAYPTTEGQWQVMIVNNRESGKSGDSLLLEGREQFVVGVKLPSKVNANEQFVLSIRPAVGTAYSIDRTAPERIKEINPLY
jgi:flagellin FlaB